MSCKIYFCSLVGRDFFSSSIVIFLLSESSRFTLIIVCLEICV